MYLTNQQLADYIKLYNVRGEGHPKAFKTFREYDIMFPKFENWYKYKDNDLYNEADSYLYAEGNNIESNT